jgi:hypothetical protein
MSDEEIFLQLLEVWGDKFILKKAPKPDCYTVLDLCIGNAREAGGRKGGREGGRGREREGGREGWGEGGMERRMARGEAGEVRREGGGGKSG